VECVWNLRDLRKANGGTVLPARIRLFGIAGAHWSAVKDAARDAQGTRDDLMPLNTPEIRRGIGSQDRA
jgi:hypothetical protein